MELPSHRSHVARWLRVVEQEIVHEDDHEEETLQSDEEPAKKLKINGAETLLDNWQDTEGHPGH